MKKIFVMIQLIFFILFFTGCEFENPFKPSKAEIQLKEKELDATIEQNKEQLKVQKELELAKINNNLEKEKLLSQNKEKEAQYSLELQKAQQELQVQQYTFALIALFIIVLAFGLYVYFNNRRKDKLKAYEDNLEKYFKSKENEAKVKIANKIIDTIATGNLSSKQEKLLMANLDGKENISAKALENMPKEETIEAEVIELKQIKEEQSEASSKKKKKKKKSKDKKSKESKEK